MRKKPSKPAINRNRFWHYLTLCLCVVLMALSALPSWYGEDAALHISARGADNIDATEVANLLTQNNIDRRNIVQQDDRIVVTLVHAEQQAAAQSQLSKQLPEGTTIALASEAAAPGWLLDMGFNPVKLGLDLRGGVQFLLDVDMEPVYAAHRQMVIDDLTAELPRSRGRIVHDSAQITLRSQNDASELRKLARERFPNWQLSGSDRQFSLSLTNEEQNELRRLTVMQNLQIMRSRLAELGITEASVQRQGENRIRIELPGVQDPAAAKDVIGATASLAFHSVPHAPTRDTLVIEDQQGQSVTVSRRAVLGGEHIVDARAGVGEFGDAEVNISLDGLGGRKMANFSRQNIGNPMATVYSEYSRAHDGSSQKSSEVISVATIQSQLGNRFRITGVGSMNDAQELALLLRAGSLTAPVTIVEERTIGPSLGAENVKNGFAALALGLGITFTFIAVWYRRLGWVANAALMTNMVMLFGLIALLPGAVLTLPGIAGLVLTVGMAVDTNVLIFERIKDKMAEGRSFAASIDRGFQSAFSSIFDANLTTMIVALALYAIGNGPVQGFALTLALGLLTSMFTGIFASRIFINLIWGRDQRRDVRV
ncbi:protein translocase subunit SecD [Vibrio agarivorans]|uniref:protein translocase subunit SecD n=1 Tax=Vibrio agarivorans TaxID=153622 RepID=UPI0022319146|nr:protein translocase subunit SecD [Vibrio agarivorans]MDN3659596.1 protein translocase subunit SecD [Vibrio agarivorans]